MDLAQLQQRVSAMVRVDLGPLFQAHRARGGADDLDAFLAYLGAAQALPPEVLKEIYATNQVDLGDPATAGTAIGGFAVPGAVPVVTEPGNFAGAATAPDTRALRPTGDARPQQPARGPATRFQTLSTLGQGAMGAIAVARDVQLRRKVALKTALPKVAQNPQHMRRFVVEMQVTAQLDHPHIVPVYAVESSEAGVGYAMKLVNGVDLEHLLADAHASLEAKKPLDDDHKLEKRLDIFLRVCDAVDFAHAKGIVHRDLKPANVMIGRHNEVYLMDWGIARLIGEGGLALDAGITVGSDDVPETNVSQTRVGSLIGTPMYMSPEQVRGKSAVLDGRSDQYTMGLILQECVTLKRAVDGNRLDIVLKKALDAKPDAPPVGPSFEPMPRELMAVVRKATQKEPANRYPTMRAMADDVRRYLAGEAVSVLPEGAMRKAGRWFGRHRMTTVAIVLGLGLAGSIATIGALVVGQKRVDAVHAKELRISQLEAQAAVEAQLVDHQLTRYEASLTEFVGAAQVILSKAPPVDAPPTFDEAFAPGADGAPSDLAPSIRYGKPVSITTPVASLAPGVQRRAVDPVLRSLGWATPAFRALLIGSSGEHVRGLNRAELRAAIADVGVPGLRAAIALKEGASLSFPGMAGNPPGDDREALFYKLAAASPRPIWGPVTMNGKLASLPLSAPLYDEAGVFRGVALLEVSLDRLLARPEVASIDYVQSRYLVDRKGKTVAEDSRRGGSAPIAKEIIAAIERAESGTHEYVVDGHAWQYAYYPLAALDMYYVAVGDSRRMEASREGFETSDPRKVIAAAQPAPKPKPSATAPAATASAEPEPEAPDAGEEEDAGADAGVDAGPIRRPGPMPVVAPPPTASAAPPPVPSAAPGEPQINPFDKWQIYKKKKQQGKP